LEAGEPLDSFTVIVPDSSAFSQTLVRLDCTGQPRPGLAKWWSSDKAGRVWTFALVDPRRVVSSWSAREAAVRELGIESATVTDSNALVVTLSPLADSAPQLFASPELAVPRASSAAGAIHFLIEPKGDPRDALDRGADLVVTRDPTLVEYVSNRREFVTASLPWSRSYVLLDTGKGHDLAGALDAASVRSSLAKDAVTAGARAAEPPFWWNDHAACRATPNSQGTIASSRVVYRKQDDVGRGLAERIVALAPTTAGLGAMGLDSTEFALAVRRGADRAYVIGVPRRSFSPCRDASLWPAGSRLLPLIDTRAFAIVRRGAPPLQLEWNGGVQVAEP
jgi:hypothetical protein